MRQAKRPPSQVPFQNNEIDGGRVLSSEFWPELQFLAQLLLDFGGIMLTSF